MAEIGNVKLELLRPGPAHNQLLSPLTPYIALCGSAGPVTINLPFEHRQLLSRLERLRYATASGEIPSEQQQFEARDIGEALGAVLGEVSSLAPEISRAAGPHRAKLVHLRLSVSALELALVPFELAVAPEGFPGSGSPLFLQSRTPITVTREVRRGESLPSRWNRKPRVLFAFAQPGRVAPVPAMEHLRELRKAIEPWVKWAPDEDGQIAEVKKVLTVIENASLEAIRDECAKTEYTHVHLLAHGALLPNSDQRYGIALCAHNSRAVQNIVDGETLALALTGTDASDANARRPSLVTLATCDSGQVGSVLTPGGAIAHELNGAGIPWVIASQFPLWMRASTMMVEVLYTRLLAGDDPREVLHRLRQQLRTGSAATHDWASIVAYATVPWDFDRELEAFKNHATRSAIEARFDEAEKRARPLAAIRTATRTARRRTATAPAANAAAANAGDVETLKSIHQDIRSRLDAWCAAAATPAARSERLGLAGASEKRIGGILRSTLDATSGEAEVREAWSKSATKYRHAFEAHPTNHWVITQHLAMRAVLAGPDDYESLTRELGDTWVAARKLATWELHGACGEAAAWALGTLAEIDLLGTVYAPANYDATRTCEQIAALCHRIRENVPEDSFAIFSTRRQFQRYVEDWHRELWNAPARAALTVLPEDTSWVGRPYQGPA